MRLLLALAIVLCLPLRAADRPNILLVLADDLGFSDPGCYGGEIRTPVVDRLAAGGLSFTQFYNTGRCWPTRAALLTGHYAQAVRRDRTEGLPRSGARGRRPSWAPLLPHLLESAGYRSYHAGKWHIDGTPLEGGFHRSYHLRDQGRFFSPQVHWEDDRRLPPVERGSGYYATTAIADHALRMLDEHAARHAGRPFLLHLAFTAPHFPLHALQGDLARWRDRYREGWEVLRDQRRSRQISLGLPSWTLSPVERDLGPPYRFPDHLEQLGAGEVDRPRRWETLTPEQQSFQAAKMALHAAMIDRMDRELGRVIDRLEAMDMLQDTLVLFLSDNGASAEIMVRDDGHDPRAPPGSPDSYLCLGPGWSTVCNTPFRRHKTWVHEGGIATPLVVSWPAGIAARGELRHVPGHVIDIVPTLLEITGIDSRGTDPALPGISLLPAFGADRPGLHRELFWAHDGHRALRQGDWKLVAARDAAWELYRVGTDRGETLDLAPDHPERVVAMAARWREMMDSFARLAAQSP